ncbi:MAG: sugar transferase [Pseudomonadota bacterium]
MTPGKRLFDLGLATALLVLLWPVLLVIAALILIRDGQPVIFRSERMRAPAQPFTLLKFRTMSNDMPDDTVSAGYKSGRITAIGRGLRRSRLDELPQIFNILRGDMSFVGPRPPLPRYVALRPDLYARVLENRPGITGLATLVYRHHEEDMLARCTSVEETHETYLRRCVPAKARLDLIWARRRSVCFDTLLILRTIGSLFSHTGGGRPRARHSQTAASSSRGIKKQPD